MRTSVYIGKLKGNRASSSFPREQKQEQPFWSFWGEKGRGENGQRTLSECKRKAQHMMIQFISGEAECSVNKCSHFNSPDESACPGALPGSDRPNYLNTAQQRAFSANRRNVAT